MRCFSCSKLSIPILCKKCIEQLFVPEVSSRKVGTLDVISFFKYSTLETLLHSKHKPEGYRIYKALANMTMKPFIKEFVESDDIVSIDEYVKSGYAHVALLTQSMRTKHSMPQYCSLMAQNRVNYSD